MNKEELIHSGLLLEWASFTTRLKAAGTKPTPELINDYRPRLFDYTEDGGKVFKNCMVLSANGMLNEFVLESIPEGSIITLKI